MGVAYLIGVIGGNSENEWLDAPTFGERLQEKWSNARIETYESEGETIVAWDVVFGKYPVSGDFWAKSNTLSVEASLEYVAKLAIWYRQTVPDVLKLHIFDDMGNYQPLEITPRMAEREIVSYFTSPV